MGCYLMNIYAATLDEEFRTAAVALGYKTAWAETTIEGDARFTTEEHDGMRAEYTAARSLIRHDLLDHDTREAPTVASMERLIAVGLSGGRLPPEPEDGDYEKSRAREILKMVMERVPPPASRPKRYVPVCLAGRYYQMEVPE